ncbi:hypothetical protein ANRL3_02596 [Anaerolineae bacterium]|nr:hypothetical protein ANRL3_02596 [Anaerolineae bacterium]
MWLVQKKVFQTSKEEIDGMKSKVAKSLSENSLTVIVGNGPSQSASYLQSLFAGDETEIKVGWKSAVLRAAQEAGVPSHLLNANQNLLALAQAVFESFGRSHETEARQVLLKEIRNEFRRPIQATLIHHMLAEIAPSTIVTTNYDLQIERVFEEHHKPWRVIIRNGGERRINDVFNGTRIFKMHGTLEPDEGQSEKYIYTSGSWERRPDGSVVISESDYDECLAELKTSSAEYFLEYLRRPCLIIGKGLVWQDLSFLYALRATRHERPWSYWITPSLSDEEALNLGNLKIKPILLNMPAMPQDGHYYASLAKALACILPDLPHFYLKEIDNFIQEYDLIRAPSFVALGLAAYNTVGRVHHASGTEGESILYTLPKQGRRNFRIDAEESPGGSALTALGTFSHLDQQREYHPSLISVIGKEDIYKTAILDFCKANGIDTDGISAVVSNTWRSTVLLHDVVRAGRVFSGQRIFLDQGFNEEVILSPASHEQFEEQLNPASRQLKLVYFDKFLALPYPYRPDRKGEGGMLIKQQDVLQKLVDNRPDVDVLYETGGAGSQNLIVESSLGKYVNILTAGFPFFVRNVVSRSSRKTGHGLKKFNKKRWFDTDFTNESLAIEELLSVVDIDPERPMSREIDPPDEWIEGGRHWAGRDLPRRWMIVTLHQFGAFAMDLNSGMAYFSSSSKGTNDAIMNTAGAGDVFRGAFCYALLRKSGNVRDEYELLKAAADFAVLAATEKCKYIHMSQAYQSVAKLSENLH